MSSRSQEIIEAIVQAIPVRKGAYSRKGEFREDVREQLRGALVLALGDPKPDEFFPPNAYATVKDTIADFAKSTRFAPELRSIVEDQLVPVFHRLEEIAKNDFVVEGRFRKVIRALLG